MKYWKLGIGLVILCSCQFKQSGSDTSNNTPQTDTISVTFKRYYLFEEKPYSVDYRLIRNQKGDSILSFNYYNDSNTSSLYTFDISHGRFDLIQNSDSFGFKVVDTFNLKILGDDLTIFKYERRNPPIDGSAGFLFNQKYGLIGVSSYSWSVRTLLTNWDKTDLEKELTRALFAENARFLKPHNLHPPPPPPPRQ